MENKVSGEIYIDVYLLLDKVEPRDYDKSLFDKRISLDMLIHAFDVNSYSIPDLYTDVTRRIGDYVGEVKKQLPVIFDTLLETYDLDTLTLTSDKDIVVAGSGRVWVKRGLIVRVVGERPKLQIDELNHEVSKRINDYFGDDVAGISPEFTFTMVAPAITAC